MSHSLKILAKKQEQMSSVETVIQNINNSFAEAFNNNDFETIESLYTEDATFIPALPYESLIGKNEKGTDLVSSEKTRAWITGKSAIASFFRALKNAKQENATVETQNEMKLVLKSVSVVQYANGDVQCLALATCGNDGGYNSIYFTVQEDGTTYLIQNDIMLVA